MSDDDLVNGGIYYISTNIYKEFERQQQVVEEDIKLQNMIDELDVVTQDLEQDLDIESCVPFDYTKIEPIELIGQLGAKQSMTAQTGINNMTGSFHAIRKNSMKPGEGRQRIESFSNAMKISSDVGSNLSNEEDLMKFKRFQ